MFLPALAPPCPDSDLSTSNARAIVSAAPLHLIFNTNCVPRLFFVHLADVLSKKPDCEVINKYPQKYYNNKVCFRYGPPERKHDNFVMIETKNSVCIQIHRTGLRLDDSFMFITSCRKLLEIFQESCDEAKKIIPTISVKFALECHGKECPKNNHFIVIAIDNLKLDCNCQENLEAVLTVDQELWRVIIEKVMILKVHL